MNTCPVYRQTGGHAYGSVYAGPIGAILTPQLEHMQHAQSLPYASSLCAACYEVCPVKINIPEVLIELRAQVVNQERRQPRRWFDPMYLGMKAANFVFGERMRASGSRSVSAASACASLQAKMDGFAVFPSLGARWTMSRDLRALPEESFRDWWAMRPAKVTRDDTPGKEGSR